MQSASRLFAVFMLLLALSCSLGSGCKPTKPRRVRIDVKEEPERVVSRFLNLTVTSSPKTETSPLQDLSLERGGGVYRVPAGELEDWRKFIVAAETNTAFVLVRELVGRHPVSWKFDRLVRLRLPLPGEQLNEVSSSVLFTNRFEMPEGRSWVSELLDVSPDGQVITVKRAYPTRLEKGTRFDHRIMHYDVTTGQFSPVPK